ncbi:MAG: formate/nitrite transporter family protein [Lachnotalea sp.]
MYASDVEIFADIAVDKYRLCKNDPKRYFMRAVVAGFFLVVAIVLAYVTAALFYSTNPQMGKLLSAILFPIAIVLIVFIGGDLFTGNNMTMALGVFAKKCTWKQAIVIWVVSYVGNFVGCFIFIFIFAKSGASIPMLAEYLSHIIMSKLELTPMQLVLRGMLCNFMVCLAVLAGAKMKSESGKLVVMFCVIAAFVIAGFEHCIANMGIFSLAYLILDQVPPIAMVAKSMFFVTIGNILGGVVLLAWPLYAMAIKDK